MDDHNYVTDDDFLHDLRDYTSVLEPLPGASADHIPVGGLSGNSPEAELFELSARSLGGTQWAEELQDHRNEGRCTGESLRTEFRRRMFSKPTGAGCVKRGSVPGNTTGWITALSTAGMLASRSDSCGYACRHCSTTVCEAYRSQPFRFCSRDRHRARAA